MVWYWHICKHYATLLETFTPSVEEFVIPTNFNVISDPRRFFVENLCSQFRHNLWDKEWEKSLNGSLLELNWRETHFADSNLNGLWYQILPQYFSWNFTLKWHLFSAGFNILFNWSFCIDAFLPQGCVVFKWNSPVPSFKLQFSLGFITSCYVIFSLSMVQAIDIFMIT